jgi:AcrR family transcriptional regulator
VRPGKYRGGVGYVRKQRENARAASSRANGRAAQRNGVRRADTKASSRLGKRSANSGLTEQAIVDCTLRVIRTQGAESLSMRRLATELGVAPMSLYHHVKNKDELLERVVDTLLARVPTPAPRKNGWREQLRAYGITVIEELTCHPGIARIVTERPPTIEGQRHLRYTGEVLIAAGFDARTAAQCLATFHTFLYGVLAAQAQLPALMAVVAKRYDASSSSERNASARSPQANSVSDHLRNLGLRPWYQAGIDSILSAIALQLRSALRARASHQARGEA